MEMSNEEKLKMVIAALEEMSEDTSVPRNIRKEAAESKEKLLRADEPLDVRAASVVYKLDELANDPNIPMHGRTQIWNIMSTLETLSN